MEKRGQITIFVIIGLLIITAIALFFIFRGNVDIPGISGGTSEFNANAFLDNCISDKLDEGVKKISLQGGEINPSFGIRFKFEDDGVYRNISYICYTQNDYSPCVNQKPVLFQSVASELKSYINEDMNTCFENLIEEIKNNGYEVSEDSGINDFTIHILKDKIKIITNSKIIYSKTGQTSKIENINFEVSNELYDFLMRINDIITRETLTCDFDINTYNILYPEYDITKTSASDYSGIYTLKKENTNNMFRFAIRGCVIPPGI